MNLLFRLLIVGLVGSLLVGCARSTASTTVNNDGTWTRSIKFEQMSMDFGMSEEPESLDSTFQLPEGDGWEQTEENDETTLSITATRTFALGEASEGDITIASADEILYRNRVEVVQDGDELVYSEDFTFLGEPEVDFSEPDPDQFAKFRAELPESVSDAEIREFAIAYQRLVWGAMFGPNDPLVTTMLLDPSGFERRVRRAIGAEALAQAESLFGGSMSPAAIRDFVRSTMTIDALENSTGTEGLDPDAALAEEGEGESEPGLVSITISFLPPGEVIDTNGEIDPVTGEVFWTFYCEAAQLGEMELFVRCKRS